MLSAKEILPCDRLSLYIESYSIFEEDTEVTIYPEGVFFLLINLEEERFQEFSAKNETKVDLVPISSLAQDLKIFRNSILIRCKAFVLPKTKNTLSQISRNISSLKGLNKKDFFTGFHEFIYQIFHDNFLIDWYFRDLVNYILEEKGNISVNEMSDTFGISRQSIHRKFIKNINIGPKSLAKIWKLNNFIYLFRNGQKSVEAALDTGYYDQAHMINDFKLIYGSSPKLFTKKYPQFSIESIQNRFEGIYDPKVPINGTQFKDCQSHINS